MPEMGTSHYNLKYIAALVRQQMMWRCAVVAWVGALVGHEMMWH